jgi:hypothetical protein
MDGYAYPADLVAAIKQSEGAGSSDVDLLAYFVWLILLVSLASLAWFLWELQTGFNLQPPALFVACLVAFLFAALGYPNPPAHLTRSISVNEDRIRFHLSLPWLYRDFPMSNIKGSKELKPEALSEPIRSIVEKFNISVFKLYSVSGSPRDFHGCKNLSECLIKSYGKPPYDEKLPVRAQTIFIPVSLHGKMKKLLENAPIPDSHLEHLFG